MSAMELLLAVTAAGTATVVLSGLAVRFLRGQAASTRHAVWVLCFGLLTAAPILAVSGPGTLFLPFPPTASASPADGRGAGEASTGPEAEIVSPRQKSGIARDGREPAGRPTGRDTEASTRFGGAFGLLESIRSGGPGSGGPSAIGRALVFLWGVGVSFVLGLFGLRHLGAWRLRRRAEPDPRARISRLAARLADELGIRRPVEVRFTDELAVPAFWGFLRPTVLLPFRTRDWPEDRLRPLLLHELAHAGRLDVWRQVLVQAGCALHWMNPLAWAAARRADVERERACDDLALRGGTDSIRYAEELLSLLGGTVRGAPAGATVAAIGPGPVKERFRGILAPGTPRTAAARKVVALAAVPILLGGVAAAGIRVSAAGDDRSAVERATREPDLAGRLLASGAEARAELLALASDPDPRARERAAMGWLDVGGEAAVRGVEPLAGDPDPSVRAVTAWVLGELGGEGAARLLAPLALEDPHPHTRQMATDALGRTAARGALEPLVRQLETGGAPLRKNAAAALGRLGDPRAVPALVRVLRRDDDAPSRAAAARALGSVGPEETAAARALASASASDPSPLVRRRALEALVETGSALASSALDRALGDPAHEVRITAYWELRDGEAEGSGELLRRGAGEGSR